MENYNFKLPNINIRGGQFDGQITVYEPDMKLEIDVHVSIRIKYDFCRGDRFTPDVVWVSDSSIELSNIAVFDENGLELKIDLHDELKEAMKHEYIR